MGTGVKCVSALLLTAELSLLLQVGGNFIVSVTRLDSNRKNITNYMYFCKYIQRVCQWRGGNGARLRVNMSWVRIPASVTRLFSYFIKNILPTNFDKD